MSYSRKQWLEITEQALELVQAAREDRWSDVVEIADDLTKAYTPSNPDWVGSLLTVSGAAISTLPNPSAPLIGGSLIAAARARGIIKSGVLKSGSYLPPRQRKGKGS